MRSVVVLLSAAPAQVARLARWLGVEVACACGSGCERCHLENALAVHREDWLLRQGEGIPGSLRRDLASFHDQGDLRSQAGVAGRLP